MTDRSHFITTLHIYTGGGKHIHLAGFSRIFSRIFFSAFFSSFRPAAAAVTFLRARPTQSEASRLRRRKILIFPNLNFFPSAFFRRKTPPTRSRGRNRGRAADHAFSRARFCRRLRKNIILGEIRIRSRPSFHRSCAWKRVSCGSNIAPVVPRIIAIFDKNRIF